MAARNDASVLEGWRDPARLAATLGSFARTEGEGGEDLRAAASCVVDPWLREHLERHARDELRHAALFRARAAELRAETTGGSETHDVRAHGGGERDAHGFLRLPEVSAWGDITFVAFVHVAERRAEKLFRKAVQATADDPRTRAVFAEILRDERYHVAWTKEALERWRRAGRGGEVSRALAAARGRRLLGAVALTSARGGHAIGRVLLRTAYFTVFAPIAWLARRSAEAPRYVPAASEDDPRRHASQYG